MKTKLFYWATLSAVLLASCTDNEMREDNGKPQLEKNAYASVVIKLPSTSDNKTKAEPDYDNGDDGTGDTYAEFNVKDLTLLFFSVPAGKDEKTLAESDFILSEVVSTEASLSTGSVLPESVATTLKTGPISINDKSVRVLAVLNVGPTEGVAKDLLKLGSPFSTINKELPIPGGNLNALLGKDKDCFLMTSAPVYSGSDMKTLTECITSTNEAEAKTKPTTISVERVVAKVDLKTSEKYKQDPTDLDKMYFTVEEGSHSGDRITILGWALGNTNKSAFPFRQVDPVWASDNAYDFLWEHAISPSKSRIHWAVDPNYGQIASADKFLTPKEIATFIDQPTKAVEYCLENTSDYPMMLKSQTTRLIVKAKYIPNTAKPTASGNNTVDDDGETWWSFTTVAEHYSAKNMYWNIIGWAHDNLNTANDMPAVPTVATGITVTENNNELIGATTDRNWTITLVKNGDFHYKLAKVTYYPTGVSIAKELTGDALAGFHSSKGEVQKYDKGVCYYEIFIRHFTEAEGGYAPTDGTPWIKEGEYEAKHLGRYGVVRNNWYTVTINSIKQPGEPTIPVDGNEPVDAATAYIDCSIEITPWARRNHSVDL